MIWCFAAADKKSRGAARKGDTYGENTNQNKDGVNVLPMSARADKRKVMDVVQALDSNNDGYMQKSEIKVLISKLTGFPVMAISDNHPEVVALADIGAEDLVEKLWSITTVAHIEKYHALLRLRSPGEEDLPEDFVDLVGDLAAPTDEI